MGLGVRFLRKETAGQVAPWLGAPGVTGQALAAWRSTGVFTSAFAPVLSALPRLADDEIVPGVVSSLQGWGHNRKGIQMSVAETQPGISLNTLTDTGQVDPVSGNAAFNGTSVAISRAGA